MGGLEVEAGDRILREAGVATFPYPDSAAHLFTRLVRYGEDLKSLYETPAFPDERLGRAERERARALIDEARAADRTTLSEPESKALLGAYGIPVVETRVTTSVEAAVAAADAMGYPVVLKLVSHTITHKADVGGVRLDLATPAAVREAFAAIEASVAARHGPGHVEGVSVQPMIGGGGTELIIGSSVDPQFGPVLLFGLGGALVEVLRDDALALPPLTTTLARRMIEGTRVHEALKGVRGRGAVDLAALERLLVRVSELVVEQPAIDELDVNPLLATAERLIALDARVILHDRSVPDSALPKPAIRPYPLRYVGRWTSPDGEGFLIRPIRPEDESLIVAFHRTLSAETVYQRYFANLGYDERVAHDRLVRVCFTDYDREIALVAEHADPSSGTVSIVGVARLIRLRDRRTAEMSLIVSDAFQGHGLGRELLRRLIEVGREEGLDAIVAEILAANGPMIALTRELGFEVHGEPTADTIDARLRLDRPTT
jgi:acetyltransferase